MDLKLRPKRVNMASKLARDNESATEGRIPLQLQAMEVNKKTIQQIKLPLVYLI